MHALFSENMSEKFSTIEEPDDGELPNEEGLGKAMTTERLRTKKSDTRFDEVYVDAKRMKRMLELTSTKNYSRLLYGNLKQRLGFGARYDSHA